MYPRVGPPGQQRRKSNDLTIRFHGRNTTFPIIVPSSSISCARGASASSITLTFGLGSEPLRQSGSTRSRSASRVACFCSSVRPQVAARHHRPLVHEDLEVEGDVLAAPQAQLHQPTVRRERLDVARRVVAAEEAQHDVDAGTARRLGVAATKSSLV